jgi:iron(III) transport system permease protein
VLATDLHTQIAGLFNFSMGAVVGTLLLFPAIIAFIVNRATNTANIGAMSAKSTQLKIKLNKKRDAFFFVLCSLISLSFFILVGALAMGAFTTLYPFNMTLTLENFRFGAAYGGIGSFFNSIVMSLLTAVVGTIFVFVYSYMMEKTAGFSFLTKFGKLLSILPMALPGMVIGVSFILFFNSPSNPLNFVIGTIVILVLANMLSFFSVPFLTATGALKKLDREFEHVSDSMSIPRWKLLLRVSAPMSFPAILEIFMYYFVTSMVTISALVFLYSPTFRIASISIAHMHQAGDAAQAAAMSLLILAVNVAVRLLYEVVIFRIKRKNKKRAESST